MTKSASNKHLTQKTKEISLDFLSPQPFIELNRFRTQIEKEKRGPHHLPYQAQQKKVFVYRLVFGVLGLFFLLLCGILYTQKTNWSYQIIFDNYFSLKMILSSFCLILSSTAFLILFLIRAENEAVSLLFSRAKSKLKKTYFKKLSEYGLKQFMNGELHVKTSQAINHHYYDVKEKMLRAKEETLILLKQISQSIMSNKSEKELLFNQAIIELNKNLSKLILEFKNQKFSQST